MNGTLFYAFIKYLCKGKKSNEGRNTAQRNAAYAGGHASS